MQATGDRRSATIGKTRRKSSQVIPEKESKPVEKQEKGGDSDVQGGILKRGDRECACTPP